MCGNDAAGLIAIESLKDLNVDVKNIEILDNIHTRCFHVSYFKDKKGLSFISKKRCPLCNTKKWYENSLININAILKVIKKEDILLFDNLNSQNQRIVDKTNNKKLLDLGQYFEFENLEKNEILKKIKGKFEIINLNNRVAGYFLDKFKLKKISELYKMLGARLITITNGKSGAIFIFNDKLYNFKLKKISKEVDSTGAGDAFFSSIINDWLANKLFIDEKKLPNWYTNSCVLTTKVVKKMGARGHLQSLYKIKKISSACICEDFQSYERKQIKRCNININNLERRIINAIKSNAIKELKSINFNEKENYIFAGTGGSFAAAKFSSIIINEIYGSNTYALFPRDILYRNNEKIDKVILFSYSGTTSDLLEATSSFKSSKKFIITKGEKQKIVLKTRISKKNIISYRTGSNKGQERGFLSFEGAVAPAALFLKYYFIKHNEEMDLESFINQSINYWRVFFEEKFKNKNIKEIFKVGNIINIFSGDYTSSASYDTESKFIESGIVNCLVHEKKNFSHGRFINYENLKNFNSIYFKQNKTDDYEKKLMNYIGQGTNLIIESQYNGILCEFDLLIASQFLIYFIGKTLNVDVSKPKYSEKAMDIYFYKGKLKK